jgi:hypothetical protein
MFEKTLELKQTIITCYGREKYHYTTKSSKGSNVGYVTFTLNIKVQTWAITKVVTFTLNIKVQTWAITKIVTFTLNNDHWLLFNSLTITIT